MSHTVRTSLLDLSLEDAKSYIDDIIHEHPTAEKRQQVFAYLLSIHSEDQKTLMAQQRVSSQTAEYLKEYITRHAFDFSKRPDLFLQVVESEGDLRTLMTQSNQELFLKGRTFSSGSLVISGDDVLLDGYSAGGKAKDNSLVTSCTVNGGVEIQAQNAIIKGVKFVVQADKAVQFAVGSQNVHFEDCIFDMNGNEMFWYGENFGGSLTLKNCRVFGCGTDAANSWYFFDATSTSSATELTRLTSCTIEDCYFETTGALAIRGLQGDPNGPVTLKNNTFVFVNQSPLLWDAMEVNNSSTVVVTGNEVSGLTRDTASNEISALQTWSRSGPWSLTFKDNSISTATYVLKVATSATFYEPTGVVEQGSGVISDTLFSIARTYDSVFPKWADGVRAPVNGGSPIPASFGPMSEANYT